MMQLRQNMRVAMRSWQGLHVLDDGIFLLFRSAVSPFPPISSSVRGSRKRITHGHIIGANRFLGVVWIISIRKRVPLMKSGLLRRTSRRTNRASISMGEIHAFGGEFIEVRSFH